MEINNNKKSIIYNSVTVTIILLIVMLFCFGNYVVFAKGILNNNIIYEIKNPNGVSSYSDYRFSFDRDCWNSGFYSFERVLNMFDDDYMNDMLLNPDLYGLAEDEEEHGNEEEIEDDEE